MYPTLIFSGFRRPTGPASWAMRVVRRNIDFAKQQARQNDEHSKIIQSRKLHLGASLDFTRKLHIEDTRLRSDRFARAGGCV
jgi:hypothetical protein